MDKELNISDMLEYLILSQVFKDLNYYEYEFADGITEEINREAILKRMNKLERKLLEKYIEKE